MDARLQNSHCARARQCECLIGDDGGAVGPRPRSGRAVRIAACALIISFLVCGESWAQDSKAAPPVEASQTPESPPSANPEPPPEQIVQVGLDERVTMHLSGLPLAEALRMLSEPSKRNIVMASGIEGVVSASLYDVTFDEALKAMLVANGLGYVVDGDFIYVYPQEELARLEQEKKRIASRVFRLTYLTAAAAKPLLEPLLSKAGKIAVTPPASKGLGGDQGPDDTEGDALANSDAILVTDYEDRLEQIAAALRELDRRPRQVLIEATILRANLDEDNALGIDFTTVGGIDFATLSSVSPGAQDITTGNIPTAQLNNTNFTVRTDLNDALPAGGFTFGILKDQISVFVRALEQITDTDIIANPKILTLNKQTGQVIVGRRDGYLTTTITETSAIQTVEFLETGTVLTFRPYIGDDEIVRLEIHPKDSTGGLTDANLPFEQTTEVTTNILVKDGRTVLIGGLFREVSTATRGQVPFLGNIPGAGALFRRTRDATVREEVIILLTVHILKDSHDDDAAAEMAEDVERFRVGNRKSVQWFSRERLGQAHYRWAMEHLAAGDTEKALWDAKLAVHNCPRHIEAMKLRDELTETREWESEGSAVRRYVLDRIQDESGELKPHYGRPGPPFEIPKVEGPSGLELDEDAVTDDEMTPAKPEAVNQP